MTSFTGAELAELLGRTRKHLLAEYLKPMVDEGILELTYPDTPRHPKQAYRSAPPADDKG